MICQRRKTNKERGSAFVEFVLCFSLFWVPLFFGAAVLGFNLIRAIQVTAVCRNAGHMYAFGTDFAQSSSQSLLSSLAAGVDLTSSGNGKIVLSTITYIDDSDCTQAGLTANATSCPNWHKYVFMRQVSIPSTGGPSFSSAFGTPPASIKDPSGGITSANYLTVSGAQLTADFPSNTGITLKSGQITYISEMYGKALQPIYWSFLGSPAAVSRAYF